MYYLIKRDQLQIKHQVHVSWHQAREAPAAVRLGRGDANLGPLAYGESGDAFVEAGDYLFGAEAEFEGLAAIAGLWGGMLVGVSREMKGEP